MRTLHRGRTSATPGGGAGEYHVTPYQRCVRVGLRDETQHLFRGVNQVGGWLALSNLTIDCCDESFAYMEALLSGGKDINGRSPDSVLSAGYRFDF